LDVLIIRIVLEDVHYQIPMGFDRPASLRIL